MSEPRWATWRDRPDLRPPLVWPWTMGGLFLTFLLALAEWPYAGWGLLFLLPFAFVTRTHVKRFVSAMHAEGDEVPVRIRLYLGAGNEPLGFDEGVLVHEAGWLLFRGLRSEWSVRISDMEFDRNYWRFSYPGPDGSDRYGELDQLMESRPVYPLLRRWFDAPKPSEDPVFPPAVRSREATVASRSAFTWSMVLIGAGIAWMGIAGLAAAGAVLIGFGIVGAAVLRFAVAEWRGHRRLRRAKALPEP